MTEDEYIPNEEFVKQINLFRSGHKKALEKLIIYSEPLVNRMSKKYYSILIKHHISLDDIKQECYVALISAINHFPLDEPCNYVSFVCTSMNYQLLDYFKYHTNRQVKTNIKKGYMEFESMDKEKNSFGQLSDPYQENLFEEVEEQIDHELNKKIVHQMLSEILNDADDISLLKDIYDLDGRHLSFMELCRKYDISFSTLVCKERLLIMKLKQSKKLQNYIERLDYTPREAFHYGVNRFKNSGMSSTEYIALKHMEGQVTNMG